MTDDANAPTLPDAGVTSQPASVPGAPDVRYVMQALLGRGGMGEVWLAHDQRIDRDVAIKLMRGDAAKDPQLVARFLREARVQGRLEHPAIVPVHDLGGDAAPYFAMKRLAGTTLADVLAAQARGDADALARWPRRILLARLIDVCLAIELAHRRGVIHRDLKPANIMLGDFGETYVLDWGLARVADGNDVDAIRAADLPGDSGSGQTVAGTMLGTPGYMAPEQMRGERVDHRTDIFALGCMLFEILAGQPAVPRDRAIEATLTGARFAPSERAPEADVPPELDELCAAATAASAGERLGSARELADRIQRFLDGDRDLERRRQLASEHAAAARSALAEGDAGRSEAMREAGRAIALDPTNREALELLGGLLLEPPREIPAEARAAIYQEQQRTIRDMLHTGSVAYLVFFAIVAALGAAGTALPLAIGITLAEIGLLAGVSAYYARARRPLTPRLSLVVITMHVTLLATIAVFLGPLLIAPVLIFGYLPLALIMPGARYPVYCTVVHALAIAVPLALEWLHVVPHSYHVEGGALVLRPWAITLGPTAFLAGMVATLVAQLIAVAVSLDRYRAAQERNHEQVHVHSWHLDQLLPTSGKLRAS
ncbi:MAG TPA: protein kinase [Kofleriaceae bacterium]|nr:protein kinase [Kofleriaceae bacterium]